MTNWKQNEIVKKIEQNIKLESHKYSKKLYNVLKVSKENEYLHPM